MIKNLKFIFIFVLLLVGSSVFAQYSNEYENQMMLENPQKNEVTLLLKNEPLVALEDNSSIDVEENFGMPSNIQSPTISQEAEKDSFLSKVLHREFSRNDVPSYLLKDELTFKYEKGPFKELEIFGAYRGSVNALFNPHNYSTKYDTQTNEVGLMGKFANPDFGFRFSVQPVPHDFSNYFDKFILDSYITYDKIPHHKILLGRSRGQVGLEGGSSAYTLPFVYRSQMARVYGNTRSSALNIIGDYNYVDYRIAYGFSGRQFTSLMPGTEFNAVLNFKPFGSNNEKLGKLVIGGTFNAGHNRINYAIGTAYVSYKYKKLTTSFDAGIGDGYNGSTGISSNKTCGFAYTIAYDITPKVQLVGRIDQFDPNRHVSHNLKREYSLGINYFIKGQAFRLILDWVFCHNQNAPNSQKIIIGTQVVL